MCTCSYVHGTTNGLMSRDVGFSEAGVTDCSEPYVGVGTEHRSSRIAASAPYL